MERNIKQKLTTIYIVRHGETEWNTKGILQGHGDSALTPKEEDQAHQITAELNSIRFDEIFSSDLQRAKRTAEIIALEHRLVVKTNKLLRERYFGQFEGKSFAKYNNVLQNLLRQYKNIDTTSFNRLKIGNAETIEDSTTRLITFLRKQQLATPEKRSSWLHTAD